MSNPYINPYPNPYLQNNFSPYGRQGANFYPNWQNSYGQAQMQNIQPNQPMQPIQQLKCIPVTSIDEARATPADFMGSLSVFVDAGAQKIYTKCIANDGTAELKVYSLQNDSNTIKDEADPKTAFVSKQEFDNLSTDFFKVKDTLDKLILNLGGNYANPKEST